MKEEVAEKGVMLGWSTEVDGTKGWCVLRTAHGKQVFLRRRHLSGDVAFTFVPVPTHKRLEEARHVCPVGTTQLDLVLVERSMAVLPELRRNELWRCLPADVQACVEAEAPGHLLPPLARWRRCAAVLHGQPPEAWPRLIRAWTEEHDDSFELSDGDWMARLAETEEPSSLWPFAPSAIVHDSALSVLRATPVVDRIEAIKRWQSTPELRFGLTTTGWEEIVLDAPDPVPYWELAPPEAVRATAAVHVFKLVPPDRPAAIRRWSEAIAGFVLSDETWTRLLEDAPDPAPMWPFAPSRLARASAMERHADFMVWARSVPVADFGDAVVSADDVQARKTADDNVLIARWGGVADARRLSEYELLRLVSARRAERAVMIFCERRGWGSRDVAVEQIDESNRTGDWRRYDIHVDAPEGVLEFACLDVKNARKVRGSGLSPDICVPSFKEDRDGNDIVIVGCLSEYQSKKKEAREGGMGAVVILGFLSDADLRVLRRLAPKEVVDLDLERPGRGTTRFLPAWMFRLGSTGWSGANGWTGDLPSTTALELLQYRPYPLWIAAGLPIPTAWCEAVPVWAHSLWERLRRFSGTPFIFLSILVDFLERMLNSDSHWDAEVVSGLVYRDDDVSHPLGHHDPTQSVATLLKALAAMHEHREDLSLRAYTKFRMRNGLWVTGYTGGMPETVITYCGGVRVDRGPCGTWPLVRGREAACPECNYLVCPNCQLCSKKCGRMEELSTGGQA